MTGSSWNVEPATAESLSDILAIEEACFSAPWTRKMFEAELSGNPFAHFLLARLARGAETELGLVVGYLCYWIVFEEVRLMNLAVIESMRHRGIAKSLVMTALQTGLSQSAHRAVLEVRASNEAGKSLYHSLGFRHIAVRPKYYNNPVEDAVLMELDPIVLHSGAGRSVRHLTGGQNKPLH
jgi:[ribosomal protein S18]-alanine N-acetyltransferase